MNASKSVTLLIIAAYLHSGCAMMSPRQTGLPRGWSETKSGPFSIETSGGPEAIGEVVESLVELESSIDSRLGLEVPSEKFAIRVIVLDDQEQLQRLMESTHPELPSRRAFFLAEGNQRTIYACRGDRLREDLKHEATHALLNTSIGPLPLWLDEGLAEYFEIEPGDEAEIRRRAASLSEERSRGWSPDLARLESIGSIRELTARDYREAWAWTRLLLDGPPDFSNQLQNALFRSETGSNEVIFISQTLALDQALLEDRFWKSLEPKVSTSMSNQVRTQSPESKPGDQPTRTPPSARRSGLGRLIDRVGSALFGW
jgi:hypothetical protein